jgi:phosphoribosylamine--glycine ligase
LEFNCRLGDPETQAVLPRLLTDLAPLLANAAAGSLPGRLDWSTDAAVDVVLASPGYPEAPITGTPIEGVKQAADVAGVEVFHAGTARRDGELVTAGGRVLNLVGVGPDLGTARARAYEAADLIEFSGKQMRSDIAGGVT